MKQLIERSLDLETIEINRTIKSRIIFQNSNDILKFGNSKSNR